MGGGGNTLYRLKQNKTTKEKKRLLFLQLDGLS